MRRFIKRQFPQPTEIEFFTYLEKEAYQFIINEKYIERFKNRHYGRRFNGPHYNYPFCKICGKRFKVGERAFLFIVGNGWKVPYHINCVKEEGYSSRMMNIIFQDRAKRKKWGYRIK